MALSLTALLFVTVIFCVIISLILYHIKRLYLYRAAAKFEGPPVLPLIGNAHYFTGNTEDLLKSIVYLLDTYPSPFRLWLGNLLVFTVSEPDDIEVILMSPNSIEKHELYKFLQPWLGTGVFTSSGPKWRRHRKLITPTFHQRILDTFIEVFVKQSEIMTTQMEKELNKGEFEIFNYVSLCTLDIICETAMGVKLQAQMGNDTRYVDSVLRMFEIVNLRIYKVWYHFDSFFNLTKHGRDQRKCLEYLHSVTDNVIQKKKSAFNNSRQTENANAASDRKTTKKTFLDLLIEISQEGAELTDQEFREEVDTMIIAGNDTSASIESFVMVMLATYPDIQEKVYQELCEIFGDEIFSSTDIDNQHLNQMEYLERVIKETMRLFPVAPILSRQITGDIKIGDRVLPAGSTAAVGTIKVHRWDKYWPDPLKFDPDRFLPEEVAKRHPYCYIPFSAGPRNCLGQKYAMMGMKALLATVLRRYVLKKDKFVEIKDIKLKIDFMLKPVEPLKLKIVERPGYSSKTKAK